MDKNDEKDAQAGGSGEVGRLVAAVSETARRYGVLLACEPAAESVVAAVGVGYLAHVGEGVLELCRTDWCAPRPGQVVLGPLDPTDAEVVALSRRVLTGFGKKAGREGARRAALACASDDPDAPETIHRYLRLGFERPWELRPQATDKRVLAVDELARLVLGELERTRQLARFSPLRDGSLIACVEPAAHVVPLVAPHFARLLHAERFCLVDPHHHVAAFHEARASRCVLVGLDERLCERLAGMTGDELAQNGRCIRTLWSLFRSQTQKAPRR